MCQRVQPQQVSSTFLGRTPVEAAYGPLRVLQTHAMVSTPGIATPEAAGSYCIAHIVQDRCFSHEGFHAAHDALHALSHADA